MNRTRPSLLSFVWLAAMAVNAQTSPYRLTPAVTSASVIDGQDMHACLPPDRVALSDVGEVAFVLPCRTGELEMSGMVLTSHRVVATDKELIDGKTLRISTDSPIAINSRGQVAYVVTYYIGNDLKNAAYDETEWRTGICVEKHLLVQVPNNVSVNSLTLGEDGTVSFNQQPHQAASTSTSSQSLQAIPNAIHQIPIKLPPIKLPKNFPIGIPSIGNSQPRQSGPQHMVPAHGVDTPLSMFAANSRGQIAINTRVTMFEFAILLATPTN